ncbi:MAG TPA: hypothetical protein VK137_03875 [Planctomycetaceae bacterium]|nr:hypothetical protein [Planctomycetaceae bacterium]
MIATEGRERGELREFFRSHPTRPLDSENDTGSTGATAEPALDTNTHPTNGDTTNGQVD